MKRIFFLLLCGLALAAPTFAAWNPPTFLIAPNQNGIIPNGVIEVMTPADITLWANTSWDDHQGDPLKLQRVSLSYEIWGTGTPGDFQVNHMAQPNEVYKIGEAFKWAEIITDKPHCTYFQVQANMQMDGWYEPICSNKLTFHLYSTPEPNTFIAFSTGALGIAGMFIKRRR